MVKFLALLHRYGWFVIMALCTCFISPILVAGMGFFSFSLWSFIGYVFKWKHIYCSYQNAYHEKMTPYNINWSKIKKSDAVGVPLIFLFFSMVSFVLYSLK